MSLFNFTHKELVGVGYKWVLKSGKCGVAFKELNTNCCNGEYPDVIGFGAWANSVLIEVKISRSDFLSDKSKSFRKNPELGMGMYRFYMCPWGLIKPEDLPTNWGLIWVNEMGKAKCMINPYCKSKVGNVWSGGFEQNLKAEHGLMYSALRRLHIKGHIDSIYDKQYNYNHKD